MKHEKHPPNTCNTLNRILQNRHGRCNGRKRHTRKRRNGFNRLCKNGGQNLCQRAFQIQNEGTGQEMHNSGMEPGRPQYGYCCAGIHVQGRGG